MRSVPASFWLSPWWPTGGMDATFHDTFRHQLEREVPPGHVLYGVPTRLIARGGGDDCLFELLDGSGRLATVHLTWSGGSERLPWPQAWLHDGLEAWAEGVMRPEHGGPDAAHGRRG